MSTLKIVIDSGHGLYTAGKRCMKKLDPKETREWYLNDRIADELERQLANYDCEVLRVDDTTGLTDVSLANRVKKANNWGADVYLSIHHNAGVKGGKGGGTVVFYYSSSAADKERANNLYDAIVKQTGLKGNRVTKVGKSAFYVLKYTKMSAFLLENGFMDSATDVPIILSQAHANKTVKGFINFLVDNYKLTKLKVETPINSFKVKVKVAELNIRGGAGAEFNKTGSIKDKGVYTIVATAKAKDGGTWGKLKSGAGWINISSAFVTRV